MLAGLSSDEEDKSTQVQKNPPPKNSNPTSNPNPDFSKQISPSNPQSMKIESPYKPEKKAIFTNDPPAHQIKEKTLSKPAARVGDDYDDLLNQMDEEVKAEPEIIPS